MSIRPTDDLDPSTELTPCELSAIASAVIASFYLLLSVFADGHTPFTETEWNDFPTSRILFFSIATIASGLGWLAVAWARPKREATWCIFWGEMMVSLFWLWLVPVRIGVAYFQFEIRGG